MAFPSYGATLPALLPYQFSFRGYVFGPYTPFELKKIEGLDLPAIRSGDAGRPRDHGLFRGLDVMGGREITISGEVTKGPKLLQNAIIDPSFEYDTVGAAPTNWVQSNSGKITESAFLVSNAWAASGRQSLFVKGKHSGEAVAEDVNAIQPLSAPAMVATTPGAIWTLQCVVNILKALNEGAWLKVNYYKADGKTFISAENLAVFARGATGVATLTGVTKAAPAETAYMRVEVKARSTEPNAVIEYYVADVIALEGEHTPLTYFDGDTPGYYWTGTPGASISQNLGGGKGFAETLNELSTATIPSGNVEYPLYLNVPGYGTLATEARIRKRTVPRDLKFVLGELADVALMFASSDPRWYGATQQASTTTTGATKGFAFPLTFPLSFGGGSTAGALSINNEGNIETRPILIVEGPCKYPSITNSTAPGAPNLTFDVTMAAGDKLVIDTDMHTALYYTAGSSQGATRINTLALGSKWFVLEPGTSTIQFLSQTGEGKLTVEWASAWVLA